MRNKPWVRWIKKWPESFAITCCEAVILKLETNLALHGIPTITSTDYITDTTEDKVEGKEETAPSSDEPAGEEGSRKLK